jgi:hypothetical protein
LPFACMRIVACTIESNCASVSAMFAASATTHPCRTARSPSYRSWSAARHRRQECAYPHALAPRDAGY